MANIFWDTNLFIYLLEGNTSFGAVVKDLRRRMLQRNDRLFTSAITIGEILVKPLSTGDNMLGESISGILQRSATHRFDVRLGCRGGLRHYPPGSCDSSRGCHSIGMRRGSRNRSVHHERRPAKQEEHSRNQVHFRFERSADLTVPRRQATEIPAARATRSGSASPTATRRRRLRDNPESTWDLV